ncbi:hypothetical protein D917_07247 [Trichinella nativa]|uniref:Uncharacterized protein n=1 Tax=Trichinella nativa TaxID=6335 RepID=A0A1Y3ETE6_9BILA|nr:hypothetical protein D917_07247 [Trichinella nativa]
MNWYILIHRSYLRLEAFSQLDRLYVNGSVDIYVFTDRRCYLQTWPMNMILVFSTSDIGFFSPNYSLVLLSDLSTYLPTMAVVFFTVLLIPRCHSKQRRLSQLVVSHFVFSVGWLMNPDISMMYSSPSLNMVSTDSLTLNGSPMLGNTMDSLHVVTSCLGPVAQSAPAFPVAPEQNRKIVMDYEADFPKLATSTNAPGTTLSALATTPAIRSTTVTQIFQLPYEERKFRVKQDNQYGSNERNSEQIECNDIMQKTVTCSTTISSWENNTAGRNTVQLLVIVKRPYVAYYVEFSKRGN